MKIVNLSQRDDDWKAWRKQGITASDAAILLNRSPYKTRWRLWAEKTGFAREVDLSLNPLVRRGIRNEDVARQAFEAKHSDLLLPVCVESEEYPLMRASLDGLRENGEPVELKSPGQTVWESVYADETSSRAYQLYYPQIQHQVLVTEAKQGWLVFHYEGQLKEFHISRDEAMLKALLAEAEVFWKLVEERKEPDKDPKRDLYIPQGSEAADWIYAAEQYRLYDSEIQELKRRLKELNGKQKPHLETMKALMGEYFHADYCGVMVTRYMASGRVDYKKLLKDKAAGITPAEIEQYRDGASERCRVTVTDSVKPRYIMDDGVLSALEDVPEEVESSYF